MSPRVPTRRTAVAAVLAALLLGAAGSTSAPAAQVAPTVRNLDLAASADPTPADRVVADRAFRVTDLDHRDVRSDVTATGSATCDGCDATGAALQVLYVEGGREARLDNTAVAWTQDCAGCTATALSVQVVVLHGVPSIVPNNRALALNAACASCGAGSLAYQLVVSTPRTTRLSAFTLAALRAWVYGQARSLHGSATGPVRRARLADRAALGDLAGLVRADVGGVTVAADVDRGR